MRIKVLRNLGSDLPDFSENEEVEVGTKLGEDLIAKKLAIRLEQPEPEIKAVPIAETEAVADEDESKEPEAAPTKSRRRSSK